MLLLWEVGTLLEELSTLPKRQGGAGGVQPNKIPNSKNTSATAESEELLLISEQNEVNLVGDESMWVIDSGASFHLTPD